MSAANRWHSLIPRCSPTLGNVKSGRMRLCIRLALVYVPDHVVWSGT